MCVCLLLRSADIDVVLQILWTFSLYLEAVAILPQLVLLQRTQNIDNLTGNYILLLGYGVHMLLTNGPLHCCKAAIVA